MLVPDFPTHRLLHSNDSLQHHVLVVELQLGLITFYLLVLNVGNEGMIHNH